MKHLTIDLLQALTQEESAKLQTIINRQLITALVGGVALFAVGALGGHLYNKTCEKQIHDFIESIQK